MMDDTKKLATTTWARPSVSVIVCLAIVLQVSLANAQGNVLGLMPHPERACDPVTGSTAGRAILEALLS